MEGLLEPGYESVAGRKIGPDSTSGCTPYVLPVARHAKFATIDRLATLIKPGGPTVKQNIGLGAVFFAVMMVAIRPGGQGTAPGGKSQASNPPSKAAASQTAPLAGPWLATRAFFQAPEVPDPP